MLSTGEWGYIFELDKQQNSVFSNNKRMISVRINIVIKVIRTLKNTRMVKKCIHIYVAKILT